MYDIFGYGGMIADTGRISSYALALQANVKPGSVILDIGAGPGILSLLACRNGAARVYAVEPDDVIELARQAAAANGFADRIECIQAKTTDIVLPEKVDGIVTDVRGVLPLFRTSVISILDARDRFLKSAGWIVAARDTLHAALVSSQSLYDRITGPWNKECGFDFSSARATATNQWLGTSVYAEDLLTESRCWGVLDYMNLREPSVSGEASWTVDCSAVGHGVSVWFDCETAPGLGFSNSPAASERHVYKQALFPWPEATELVSGDQVSVQFRADFVNLDYVWAWDTRITERGSGQVKRTYRQSSFMGMSFSSEHLRKRRHTFVPEPNEDSRIDQRIITLMDQKLTLCQIGSKILAEFPSRFKDWTAALTRVGDLSERYSK